MIKKILNEETGISTTETLVVLAAVTAIAASIVSLLLPSVLGLFTRMQDGVRGINETGF